ncbi:hypothetical protein KC952_01440 [Candidatus Saccharibacteria bacterium]|nr:hypothetical protein [Candidatus Saccharibacteria bacterium]
MLIVGILTWWYGNGIMQRVQIIFERFLSTLDYFSPGLLVATWFAPFRQISAGRVRGGFGVAWRAFIDRLVSRMIGGLIRTTLLIASIVVLAFHALIGLVEIVGWIVLPLIPFVGIGLAVFGWTPSWI